MAGRDDSGWSQRAHRRLEAQSSAGTTKQCKHWELSGSLAVQLRGLTDQELALLIASQFKGTVKDSVYIMEVEDLEGSCGLHVA